MYNMLDLFHEPPAWPKLAVAIRDSSVPTVLFHLVKSQLEQERRDWKNEKHERFRNLCLHVLADKGFNLCYKIPLVKEAFLILKDTYEVSSEDDSQAYWVDSRSNSKIPSVGLKHLDSICYVREKIGPDMAWITDAMHTELVGVLGVLLLPEEYLPQFISGKVSTIGTVAKARLSGELQLPTVDLNTPWSPVEDSTGKVYLYTEHGSNFPKS